MIKNILKIAGVVLVLLILLVITFLIYLSRKSAVEKDYMKKVDTGGELEDRYIQMGAYEVSYLESPAMQNFKKYEFYYPAEIISTEKKFPAVIFSNGTGVVGSKYSAILEHLASWGFIVAATEEEYSWNGFSSEMCLQKLLSLNHTENVDGWDSNPFYGKVDVERIGASGHSQGGVGVINAVTDTKHAELYKAVFCVSPTNKELSKALEWEYDASKINVPILLLSSTGRGDEALVVSGEQLQSIYDDISDTVPKIMARRNDADHGEMLYCGDGYMTAWFLWQLQEDETAKKVFLGDRAEILDNPYYQDILSNLQ